MGLDDYVDAIAADLPNQAVEQESARAQSGVSGGIRRAAELRSILARFWRGVGSLRVPFWFDFGSFLARFHAYQRHSAAGTD